MASSARRHRAALHRQSTGIGDFLPDIIAFGRVTGFARVFLEAEIILSVLVVIGTCILIVVRFAALQQ